MCCVPSDLPVCDEERWIYNRAPHGVKKKVLRGGVHHRNYEQQQLLFTLFSSREKTFRERTLIGLDVLFVTLHLAEK